MLLMMRNRACGSPAQTPGAVRTSTTVAMFLLDTS